MMSKISYLKGLLDGLQVHPESREGKIFYAVCEALEETASYAEKLESRVAELEELCDILDEDLGLVEEMVEDTACGCTNCDSQMLAYDRPERFSVSQMDAEQDDNTDDSETAPEEEQAEKAVEDTVKLEDAVETIHESVNEATDDDKNDTESFLEDGEEEYETTCPTCGECILLTEKMLEEGETICPNCGEELEFDFDEEEIERLAPAEDE
ncbi:MAG: hypothetical protein K2H89_00080 [Oscillospiraceae bacterium]|nr:hypothetical protein [Oscillospiraceae bacterium]